MTAIPTYVSLIPLPAPVTSGTTIQSYTDPNGDVWVAKNGVNSGNWYRARDVIQARAYRTAAYTYPTSATNTPLNLIDRDVYGLYSTSTYLYTAPVPGLYRYDFQLCVTFTAAMQFIGVQSIRLRTNLYAPGACNSYAKGSDVVFLNAGDTIGLTSYTNVGLSMAGLNNSDQYFGFKYEGTG